MAVARQPGSRARDNQSGDSAALVRMILAPDCRWQAACCGFGQAVSAKCGSCCGSAFRPVLAGRPFRCVADFWRKRRDGCTLRRGIAL